MDRISTNLPNDSMQFHLRERTKAMEQLSNQLAGQTRILNLRDDPMAAAHATRYRSYTARLERFSENIETIRDRNVITEGYIQQAGDMLQRAREIAVQSANGTYTAEDMRHMATEIDQILNEMVEVANARGSDGTTIFSGDRGNQLPFRAVEGIRAGGERSVITEVQYRGTINRQNAEIGENSFIQTNWPGNQVFWAENQQITSRTDARDFQVHQNGTVSVDGVDIEVREGDTVHSLVHKINESGAPVKAHVDPVYSSLVIQSTSPHQIWLEDDTQGRVFERLGLVRSAQDPPPDNVAPSALRSGGSVFDTLISLRDNLFAGDQEAIGGRGIQSVDQALDNIFAGLGKLGAINSRLDYAYERTEMEIPRVIAQDSRNTDVDMAEAIMELRQLEQTHRAALGASARVIQPTLLDFLR